MNVTAADLVARARSSIREVSADEYRGRPAGPALLVDVREPAEFAAGHLKDAINVPRGMLEFEIETHLAASTAHHSAAPDRDRHIVLYCLSGGRAALAAASLQELGYSNVESIRGGLRACTEAGIELAARAG